MKKGTGLYAAICLLLISGCSTSPQTVKENFDKVMLENKERTYARGTLAADQISTIKWNDQMYTITQTETAVEEMIGDITETILIDETDGHRITNEERSFMKPQDANAQKRTLLQFGFLYSIPNVAPEEEIAVEINHVYYRATRQQ